MKSNEEKTTCSYCHSRLSGPKLRSGENIAVLVRYKGKDFVFCCYCVYQMDNMKVKDLFDECDAIEEML